MYKTLTQWLTAFENGEFTPKYEDRKTRYGIHHKACYAGWVDWFCNDEHCLTALKTLAPKIKALADSKMIDKDNTYVIFENKCPVVGPTYDMFSLVDMKTDSELYCFANLKQGCYGRDFSGWIVYGYKGTTWDEVMRGTWRDVKKFFKI